MKYKKPVINVINLINDNFRINHDEYYTSFDVFEYTAKQVKLKLTSQEFLKIRNRPGFESSMIYLRTKFD